MMFWRVLEMNWMIERDQAGGALCSARVPRSGFACPPPFASPSRAPHRPDPEPPSRLKNAGHEPLQAEGIGWLTERSKGGETGTPGSEDMSAVGHPVALARTNITRTSIRAPAQWSH